uniref:Uncharacterized protein n=1 Tax=Arundo donax TaxID=35708 RepID=A0A0A9B3J7_ARUDO
MFSCRWMSSHR